MIKNKGTIKNEKNEINQRIHSKITFPLSKSSKFPHYNMLLRFDALPAGNTNKFSTPTQCWYLDGTCPWTGQSGTVPDLGQEGVMSLDIWDIYIIFIYIANLI